MISVSFILLKFILHVINKQFLDKFDNGLKKNKIPDLLRFLALLLILLKKGRLLQLKFGVVGVNIYLWAR